MILIDIKSLEPGIHEYDWVPEAEALELDPHVFHELKVEARLDFHPSRILVTIHTHAKVRLMCDRTLVEFDQPVEGQHSVLFSGAELPEGMEEQDDGIIKLGSADEEIDLTDVVRDTFVLSIPARKIAPGAEHENIPLVFGATKSDDSVVDPRWEVLRKLSSSGRKNEGKEN